MKKEYESPTFEFNIIVFCEDILTASNPYPTIGTEPETNATDGQDNFGSGDNYDPFG